MGGNLLFTEEEMMIDEGLGYPKAFAKLCRDRSMSSPYIHGPPFTFTPYALQQQHEACRTKEFDEMFPIIDPKAKPTVKPKIFVSLLWKQLNHLGNAGFDPATFRVDPYGNVLYYHADSASPLAWEIDHWFPCSRGGLTVPSNIRILQWQVCKNKTNKLEFLIPWWDFQLGISINQFLSIFASSNSDFRCRAFSLLFTEGENEELNASQTVDSHMFPKHFIESKEKVGLAPAAIVLTRRESDDSSSTLKSLDMNRRPRSNSPLIASRKLKIGYSKENENLDMVTNPYQAIVMARDSLRQREESAKLQTEIQKLDNEMNELKQKTEDENVSIQELELVLIKRRRRAEKCRRLAEAQSSYRAMLEKMIRDAMHQSVVYKEQVRLNQAAANALMARLEAQKALCDSSEKELYRRVKQRDEIEKQIRPEGGEHGRKRSRMDDLVLEDREDTYLDGETNDVSVKKTGDYKTVLCLPGIKPRTPSHKELRAFLEEEQKAYEGGLSMIEEGKQEEIEEEDGEVLVKDTKGNSEDENVGKEKMGEWEERYNVRFPVYEETEIEEDEESRRERGKGNVEKWLQMLLEDTPKSIDQNPENVDDSEKSKADEIIRKLKFKYPLKEKKVETEGRIEEERVEKENRTPPMRDPPYRIADKSIGNEVGGSVVKGIGRRNSFEGGKKKERNEKEKGLVRSESFRAFRRIPSSPSLILGMKKGVDCIRKKPSVIGDDDENSAPGNTFIKTIKRAVKM